jgi:hypothetical protein
MNRARILFIVAVVVLVAGQFALVRPFGMFDGG